MCELAFNRALAIVSEEVGMLTACVTRLHNDVLGQLADVGAGQLRLSRIEERVELIARDCLHAAKHVNGAGFIAGAEVFTDAPALAWWYRPSSVDKIERLVVDAAFYDYMSAQWWTNAAGEGVTATGPYVDASGTNEYVITFSRRVDLGERTAGVVAVDVPVGHFQRALQATLLELPSGTSLTDVDGAVIATNAGRLLGVTRPQKEVASRAASAGGLGWTLYAGPSGRSDPARPAGAVGRNQPGRIRRT